MFGLSPIFVQLVLNDVNVETMNVLFTAVASFCFAVIFTVYRSKGFFKRITGNWRKVALMSLLSAMGSVLYTYGISMFGSVNATFLVQFTAVFTILFGVTFFQEGFTWLETVGVVVATAGVFVLAYGDLSLDIVGIVVLLGAALFFASANSLSKLYVKNVNPVSLAGGSSMIMFLFLSTYTVLTGKLETSLLSETLIYAVIGSVTGVVLSFILFFKALQMFEVSKAATIRTIEPFLTTIFSFVILALIPTVNQLVGGVLIVLGVIVLSLAKGKQAPLDLTSIQKLAET